MNVFQWLHTLPLWYQLLFIPILLIFGQLTVRALTGKLLKKNIKIGDKVQIQDSYSEKQVQKRKNEKLSTEEIRKLRRKKK